MDPDGEFRAHFFRDVHWKVVEQPAVHENRLIRSYRNEDPRKRHRRPQRGGQWTVAKHVLFVVDQVRCDAGERNRKIVERLDTRVGKRNPVQNEAYLVARIESRGELDSALDAKLQPVREFFLILLAPVRHVFERDLAAQDKIPIDSFHQLANLFWRVSGCVKASHQAAHARARHIGDGDAMLLEPADHPDVRQPESGSAFKHKSDLRPFNGGGFVLRSRSLTGQKKSAQAQTQTGSK